MAPYGVADDVMSVPKLSWDGKVNIATLAMILAGILAIGAQQANNINTDKRVEDLEGRMRVVEGPVIERLIRVEEQGKQTIELLSRIERRQEERK